LSLPDSDIRNPPGDYALLPLLNPFLLSLFLPSTFSLLAKLSENVAGVTFLAFGNGAPDVFSSFSAINQEAAELSLGAILGAGIFVNTIVVGVIALISPFTVSFSLLQSPLCLP